jgi:hypothetical protein
MFKWMSVYDPSPLVFKKEIELEYFCKNWEIFRLKWHNIKDRVYAVKIWSWPWPMTLKINRVPDSLKD